jgi:hypothetical protein
MSKRKPSPRDLRRLIARLPALGTAAARVLDQPEFALVFAGCSPTSRAAAMVALRNSERALAAGRPCDMCPRPATAIRLAVFPSPPGRPKGKVGVAFAILCPACDRLPPARIEDAVKARVEALPAELTPGLRAGLVGPRVGGLVNLPGRAELQSCLDCGSPMWIHSADRESLEDQREEPVFICAHCATERAAAGGIDLVMAPGGFSR